MLPKFPTFKNLELSDQEAVESITRKFDPYSDFSFISMWIWNVKNEIMISEYKGNLVVKFTDYLTNKPFYSFLGENHIDELIKKLFSLCEKEKIDPELKLIPSTTVKNICSDSFHIEDDPDNFDYIYNINELSKMDGGQFKKKRNLIKNFTNKYQHISIKILDLTDQFYKKKLLDIDTTWLQNKADKNKETDGIQNEAIALQRLFSLENSKQLICMGILENTEIIGFTINELLPNDYSISHFAKIVDDNSNGGFSYLMMENSKMLEKFNKKLLNFEQDLGLEGLKFSKKSFRPNNFLNKYKIKPKLS